MYVLTLWYLKAPRSGAVPGMCSQKYVHFFLFRGWKAVSISGDKAQAARNMALSLFKDGSSPLMVSSYSADIYFWT